MMVASGELQYLYRWQHWSEPAFMASLAGGLSTLGRQRVAGLLLGVDALTPCNCRYLTVSTLPSTCTHYFGAAASALGVFMNYVVFLCTTMTSPLATSVTGENGYVLVVAGVGSQLCPFSFNFTAAASIIIVHAPA